MERRNRLAYACLTLGPGGPGWTLVSAEPLTVTPSIACHDCDHHGFITDGQWMAV